MSIEARRIYFFDVIIEPILYLRVLNSYKTKAFNSYQVIRYHRIVSRAKSSKSTGQIWWTRKRKKKENYYYGETMVGYERWENPF
ncbi:MAG: hypothetical protein A2032_03910 [Chloroflexi bacterium RBG_19FT_COMBO_49_13]|nr:MAG: hypothetical protein A2032_03910 [Chloroflexi bacterium RBG_19FT_COMBO_49_13]